MVGNNNNNDKEIELEVFNRFSRIVKEKFSSLVDGTNTNQLDTLYKQPSFRAEKKILNEMNSMGLYKGVVTGLGCFAFLRISPALISNMLRRRAGVPMGGGTTTNPFKKSSSGYKFDPPPHTSDVATQQHQAAPNLERPGLIFRIMRLSLDTFVSLSVGAYASLFFVDKNLLMKDFAEIPLVEGRSLLAEELCDDFTTEFQKFDPQIWNRNHPSLSSGGGSSVNTDSGRRETDFRNAIQGFVVNCRKRAIYEDEIRKERGMRDEEILDVPPPGVPNIAVTLEDLLGDGSNMENEDNNGDDYFDTYFDMSDGDSDGDKQID